MEEGVWYDGDERNGLFHDVGTLAGECVADGKKIDIIGIIYPTCEGGEEVRCMTLPCAKALLIDLRDAIESAIRYKQGRNE